MCFSAMMKVPEREKDSMDKPTNSRENVIDRILATDTTNVEVIVNGHDFTRDGTCESDYFTSEPE